MAAGLARASATEYADRDVPSLRDSSRRPVQTLRQTARPNDDGDASTTTGAAREMSQTEASRLVEELMESVVAARREPSALDRAILAAQSLLRAGDIDSTEWIRTARALRAAAVERRRSSPRVASVALMLSDALAFTDPATMAIADRAPLRVGCEALMQPFVSTNDERRVLQALLDHRWHVTAPFDPDSFAAAAGAA